MGDGTHGHPYTREDVLRLIEEHGGTAKGLDLSGKVFEAGIDLQGIELQGIILKSTVFNEILVPRLSGANLEKANLSGAHMEGAKLWYVHLERADLSHAHLEGAVLADAHLEKANLFDAHLEGAYLGGAHLEGACLYGTKFSQDDTLRNLALRDAALEDVDWGNYVLGDEQEHEFDLAEDTYRRLKQWYTNAGIYDTAAKFYYREKEANRKALRLRSKDWHNRLAAEFMRALFGYGEEWKRIFGWIAVVIFGLAGVYHFWGSFSSSSFRDTLYYSAVSFTALGYGKWAPQPTGWAKGVGVAEAIIGVFMMALVLVTFVRKWTR